VSTRETKKLATEDTAEGSPPPSTRRSTPRMYASTTSAWRSSEKMSVTLIARPAAMQSSIAPSPGSVPGIFTYRFGRSPSSCRRIASA
jgi:hypothetical protein